MPVSAAAFLLGAAYAAWTIVTQSHVTNSSVLLILLSVVIFLVGWCPSRSRRCAFEGRRPMSRVGAGDRADLQRAREPAGAGRTALMAHPERPRAGRRRSVARRHRRGRRRARARLSGPHRGDAPHRAARARPFVHRRHHARRSTSRWTSSARWTPTSRTIRVTCRDLIAAQRARRRRDRIALHAGRRDRQLAAAAPAAQPLRQHLHPRGHAARARATAPAATAAGGARRWRALPLDEFVSDGYSFLVEMLFAASRARPADSPKCRSRSSSGAQGESKLSTAVLIESAITPWRLIATREDGAADGPLSPFRAMV